MVVILDPAEYDAWLSCPVRCLRFWTCSRRPSLEGLRTSWRVLLLSPA